MKKINYTFLLPLMLLGCFSSFAQNNTWTKEPSLANTLYSPYTFAVGTHVYVIGGIEAFGPGVTYPATMSHSVWDYNTVSNTWSQKADFPGVSMYDGKGFAIGNYGYLVNGWDSTGSGEGPNTLWQYDPSTDSWAQKAPFPGSVRYTPATFVLSGKAYVACGFSPYTNEVYCYDPNTDSWTQKNNFPGMPRQAPTYFTIGNYAYMGLGATGDGHGSYFVLSDWYRYDTTGDTWTRLGDFPSDAIYATHNFVLNGEGYVVNGLNQNCVYYNTSTAVNTSNKVWKYTPNTDTWSLWGVFPDSSAFDGCSATCGVAGYMGFSAYNFNTFPLSRSFYRFGPSVGPYSCNITLDKYVVSNAVYNFQANGNFSPTAVLSWNFGDGQTGTGTSVIHHYPVTGTYIVTVNINDTASSCNNSATDTVIISNINNCSVAINSINYGTVFTLSSIVTNGTGPYTYQWSTSSDSTFSSTAPDPVVTIPLNVPASYCVTVTDTSGCIATACKSVVDSQTIYSPCQIFVAVYPDSTIPGTYYAVIYTSGASNLNYLWDFGDGTTSNLEFPTHSYNVPGRYIICVTVSDTIGGCSYTFCDSSFYAFKYGGGPMREFGVKQQITLGVNDVTAVSGIDVYPNPVNAELTITTAGQKVDNATIYNTAGQVVSSVKSPSQNKMNVSSLADGIYFIEIKVNDATTRVKFVKAN